MAKYFVDTCVWRDFWEGRTGYSEESLSAQAYDFVKRIIKKKLTILISREVAEELAKEYDEEQITERLQWLLMSGRIITIKTTDEEWREARELSKERNLPLHDCLFAVQARNHDAILITQDKHFFLNLSDIAKIRRPKAD